MGCSAGRQAASATPRATERGVIDRPGEGFAPTTAPVRPVEPEPEAKLIHGLVDAQLRRIQKPPDAERG
jgi:hypothetical protein